MIKFKTFSLAAVLPAIFFAATGAQAQWSVIKHSLQKDVHIATETKTRLVLFHQALGDSLVLTSGHEYDSDIYGDFEVKRGGNPYRVWVVTEKFLNSPRFALDARRKFFSESFLRTLRREEPMTKPAPLTGARATQGVEAASDPDSGATRIEKAGTKDLTIEQVKSDLAAADSLRHTEKSDSLQTALVQPAQQAAEKVLETPLQARDTRQRPVETKNRKPYSKRTGKTPPFKPEVEATPSASSHALLDSLYLSALAAIKEEDWRQAAFNLEKLQLLQPAYKNVVDLLALVRVNLISKKLESEAEAQSGRYIFVGGAIASIGAFIALIVLPFIGVILISPTIRAHYHIFRGHYVEAAQIYEKLLVRRPNRKKYFSALANLYLRLGRRDETALKVYEMVLQLNLAVRNREEINSIVSHNYLTKGRTDANVIEVLEDALKAERLKQKSGK
jgi:tetratricopeptide (TPR) repeat protein